MSKAVEILEKLKSGWVSVPDLLAETGWQPQTLRGAISTQARKLGLKVERDRQDGVTSYRVVQQ